MAEEAKGDRKVGLVYDDRMCKHFNTDGEHHPENPDRVRTIWNALQSAGVSQRCVMLNAKEAEDEFIELVHSKNHIKLVHSIGSLRTDSQRRKIESKFNSIYLNEGSTEAAYLAAGSVLAAAQTVASGELESAFAIVRPPGHHAEKNEPMGFCLYNNVAIAASFLLEKRPELGVKKILIVDWDVHHGNGTQKMFWKDSRVLFFSVHRHEFGSFYPANDDGNFDMVGEGPGAGYNINVPWENGRCGDSDYLAVWDHILLPVARDYNPDLIIVSAGFDAAVGDPLGGCRLTPYGYSVLLAKLLDLADGKIVMALEGGYNLKSTASSVLSCVKVLLERKPIAGSIEAYPFESTWRVIKAVRRQLCQFWPTLADDLPTNLTSSAAGLVAKAWSSDSGSENDESVETPLQQNISQLDHEDILVPLSNLTLNGNHPEKLPSVSTAWRSELSKVEVWYAAFGSNMYKPRFLCYIKGGQVEGMKRACYGSVDCSSPKEVLWKAVPHRLFFGRESTITWGPGGVAFLNPQSSSEDSTHVCLYRITLEQFNDVLFQENCLKPATVESPLVSLDDFDYIIKNKSIFVERLQGGWYHTVLHLGQESGIPILTMTCSTSDVESFKAGRHPVRPPPKEYTNVLVRGLVEGKQLSEEEAVAIIQDAASRPL
uniref:histone deacetylase n=1 Tax=Kalanchoe fedtschenkoi TaxID=63787 RepID=A0A7N0TC05_KALFE